MPIQRGWQEPKAPAGPYIFVPIQRDRRTADMNHGQTLERLAQRGGMSWCEMAAIMLGKRYDDLPRQDQAYWKRVCEDVLKVRERGGNVQCGFPELPADGALGRQDEADQRNGTHTNSSSEEIK